MNRDDFMPHSIVKRHNIRTWLHQLPSKYHSGGFNGKAYEYTNKLKYGRSQSLTQQSQACIVAETFRQLHLIQSRVLVLFYPVCQ